MVWPINRKPMSQGSINLTDEAFASQRMTALSPITSNREMHASQNKRAGIQANSQLVGKSETNPETNFAEIGCDAPKSTSGSQYLPYCPSAKSFWNRR